jgi:hypothetical protein
MCRCYQEGDVAPHHEISSTDSWELQKKAVPLVDTPNSVLRKLLGLEKGQGSGLGPGSGGGIIGITLKDLHTPRSFALIPAPKQQRGFFPGYKVDIYIETDVGTIQTRMASAPRGYTSG